MKALLTLALVFGVATAADDKKFDAEKMVGKWKLTGGKKAGSAVTDESKKGWYDITKDKFFIKGEDGKDMFVIEYTLDAKASPAAVDMKITKSPGDSANDSKGLGIVKVDGDKFEICYDPEGKKRPENFEGEKAFWFTFERMKEEKKK